MVERQKETGRVSIGLLVGRGSRTPALYKHLDSPEAKVQIVVAVSHKGLDVDAQGNKSDVPGIAEARKRGIRAEYFNLAQMWSAAKKVNPQLDKATFRQDYFRVLGAFLKQEYPVRPVVIFMLGWDLIVSEEFLKFFPGPTDGVYNVINLHPAQLPDEPGGKTASLPSGSQIPILRGEHDAVINEAIRLKLPALGACMHFAAVKADQGGFIIRRVEVPITGDDTLETYEKELLVAEEKLVIEVVDLFAEGKIRVEGSKVVVD